jgi:hypothetical protein
MPRLTGSADGVEYIHASAIHDEPGYEDVDPPMLRGWVAAGAIVPVTRAEWAVAMGRALPGGLTVRPDAPAQYPGPKGPENVYRWADVVRVETDRRQARRRNGGRPRRQGPQ